MRDLVAAVVAVLLLLVAVSLATTLHAHRRRRQKARESQAALGRTIIAELPTADQLVLVTQDDRFIYYGDQGIDKESIVAVRVLINGSPIASCVSERHHTAASQPPTSFEDRPEGIARDRWDVAVETAAGRTLVECGAIRERISQELARTVYEAIRADLEKRDRDYHSTSDAPAR